MAEKRGKPESPRKGDKDAPKPRTGYSGDRGSLNEGVTDSDKGWEPKKEESGGKKEK